MGYRYRGRYLDGIVGVGYLLVVVVHVGYVVVFVFGNVDRFGIGFLFLGFLMCLVGVFGIVFWWNRSIVVGVGSLREVFLFGFVVG